MLSNSSSFSLFDALSISCVMAWHSEEADEAEEAGLLDTVAGGSRVYNALRVLHPDCMKVMQITAVVRRYFIFIVLYFSVGFG